MPPAAIEIEPLLLSEYIQILNMPKEILLRRTKHADYEDFSNMPVVFEYKGRTGEINDFVRLAKEAGLSAEVPEEQQTDGISQFKMTLSRKQFDKFMAVLHEWKTDI